MVIDSMDVGGNHNLNRPQKGHRLSFRAPNSSDWQDRSDRSDGSMFQTAG